jgi:hypothetical protein
MTSSGGFEGPSALTRFFDAARYAEPRKVQIHLSNSPRHSRSKNGVASLAYARVSAAFIQA